MYESSILLIELSDFKISQLHVPQVRFLASTNLYESGICTLELYTKIFAEPARADKVVRLEGKRKKKKKNHPYL
jgi:hypothetical protein